MYYTYFSLPQKGLLKIIVESQLLFSTRKTVQIVVEIFGKKDIHLIHICNSYIQ